MHTEAEKKKFAELHAAGLSVTKAAEESGIHPRTAYRLLEHDDVKAMIIREQSEFLKSLPNARKNVQGLIDNYDNIKDPYEKDRAWKSSMEMLRSVGSLPSKNMSIVLQQMNIFQGGGNVLEPQVLKVLKSFADNLSEPIEEEADAETVDGEVVE